ncbi:unnamed protein product [Symbiodinium sp. CCMP2456]|nr:unnamed protein product [Symbiodinium sp. CCMP2456]
MLRKSTRRSGNSEIRLTRTMQLVDGISAPRQPQARPSLQVEVGLVYRPGTDAGRTRMRTTFAAAWLATGL